MTPKRKAKLALAALDAACKHIQDELGQDDGGVAALFFSGPTGEFMVNQFLQYIDLEESMKEPS